MGTKVFLDEYEGRPMCQIWIVDRDGNKRERDTRPLIGFGVKKAEAILEHLDDIRKFVEENAQASNYRY